MTFPRSTIVTYAILETATDFVPVPFVGDFLARRVHERLVKEIGSHHGLALTGSDAEAFVEEPTSSVLRSVARRGKAAFAAPFRTAFAGVFSIVAANSVASAVGRRYAHGLAVDVALDEGLDRREGFPRTAEKVVAAVERVETRPARRVLALAFRAFARAAPGPAARIGGAIERARARAPFLASTKLPVTPDEREELRTALVGSTRRAEPHTSDDERVQERAREQEPSLSSSRRPNRPTT